MINQNTESSKWDWIPAQQILETQVNSNKVQIETTPSIVLTHPEGDAYPEPYVTLVIDTEKQLKYTDELGWNWHKSWNLPNIVVRLEIKDSQTQELLLSPKNLFAQLYAVKKVQENNRIILQDVGLRGTSRLELIDGQAYFSALRFASTSYNNEGVKFHLLMCVYIQNSETDEIRILNSTISPPIFVDSRKSAGNSEQKKLYIHAEPFTFDLLDKKYFKRENKRKTEQDVEIENDFEGLFNYLTAPNIRHKVKHPLFLIIKFSSCVSLYYNPVTVEGNIKSIMEKLQSQLTKDIIMKQQTAPTEKLFYLLIEESGDPNKNKKVTEAIDFLSSCSLEIVRKQEQIPQKFLKLGDCGEILENYKQSFDLLLKIFKQLTQRFCDSDSNESEDNYSDSEPQSVKKVKVNEQPPSAAKADKLEPSEVPKSYTVSSEILQPIEKAPQPIINTTIQPPPKIPTQQINPPTKKFSSDILNKPVQQNTQAPPNQQIKKPNLSQSSFTPTGLNNPQVQMQQQAFQKPGHLPGIQSINIPAQGLQGSSQHMNPNFPYQMQPQFDNALQQQVLQQYQLQQQLLLLQQQQQLNHSTFSGQQQMMNNPLQQQLLSYMQGLGGLGLQQGQMNPQQMMGQQSQNFQQLQQQLLGQQLGIPQQLQGNLPQGLGQMMNPLNYQQQIQQLQQMANLGQFGGFNPLQMMGLYQGQQLQQQQQQYKKPSDKPDIKQEPQ